jgi:hypothetical protein
VVLEVEETGLAHVACLGACLAYDRRLESHASAGVPAEDGEGTRAGTTFASELLLGLSKKKKVSAVAVEAQQKCATHHPDEWVVT